MNERSILKAGGFVKKHSFIDEITMQGFVKVLRLFKNGDFLQLCTYSIYIIKQFNLFYSYPF